MRPPHVFLIAVSMVAALGACSLRDNSVPSSLDEVLQDAALGYVVPRSEVPLARHLPVSITQRPAAGAAMAAPRIVIDSLEGLTPELAGVVFAPVFDPLERCRTKRPSGASFRMASDGDRTQFDVVDVSATSKLVRRCLLESLALFDDDALRRATPDKPVLAALAFHDRSSRSAPDRAAVRAAVRARVTVTW